MDWNEIDKAITQYEATHPSLDTNNSCQRKIKCVNNEDNTWGGIDDASKFLIKNEIYTLEHLDVHTWHTRVYLKEFPDHWFNSVAFCENV